MAGLWHFFHINGLKAIVIFAVIVGSLEMLEMLFKESTPYSIRNSFYILSLSIFGLSVTWFEFSGTFITAALAIYWVFCILIHKKLPSIQVLRDKIALGTMGLLYTGALPIFAWKLLDAPNGVLWFITLLGVVFAGDIGAYVFGVLWGKHKVMPTLSPKKSWEGSIGGILFSISVAICSAIYLINVPVWQMAILGLVSAIFAQLGDFFESLLKRVADIKDSGKIMPGHGGVLDRIDGVLMAAPIFYLGMLILTQFITDSQF